MIFKLFRAIVIQVNNKIFLQGRVKIPTGGIAHELSAESSAEHDLVKIQSRQL